VGPGVSGASNIDTIFVMLRWAHCGFHKKCPGSRYVELMFLHPVGTTDHIAHSGALRV
jgi:hypothetical protein